MKKEHFGLAYVVIIVRRCEMEEWHCPQSETRAVAEALGEFKFQNQVSIFVEIAQLL